MMKQGMTTKDLDYKSERINNPAADKPVGERIKKPNPHQNDIEWWSRAGRD
ncbi:hypothetical protein BS47DRAFT_1345218 [Hydnum rufescens UP504]|uniref:Uncharacterized protein n=1 Tax=Hydnum rufescens UP504 TaxID=1448309 RepID=A0A9P6AWG2_9AGAM|nr:hypothetical protein BS47DRAFT_1345218 [Hydnum rufescens UP504]